MTRQQSQRAGFQQQLGQLKGKLAGLGKELSDVRRRIQKLTPATRGRPRAVVNRAKCTGCGMCGEVCPVGAINVTTHVAYVNEERCTGCGICVQNCPQGALSLVRR